MQRPSYRRAISAILLSAFIAPATSAADAPVGATTYLGDWVAIAPFIAQSREMSCANRHVGGEWTVSSAGGQLQVRPFEQPPERPLRFALPRGPEFATPSTSLEVADGVLVGFDAGEWGGGLSWFARDGSGTYRIVDSNILALAATGGRAIAIGGLAHLGRSRGQLHELERNGGRWQVARTLDIGAAPAAVARDPRGGQLLVTTAGLSRYAAGSIRQVHAADYMALFPNSLVALPNGVLFVGMRHAVVRLTPSGAGYQEAWLVRPDCAVLSISDDPSSTCSCRPTP